MAAHGALVVGAARDLKKAHAATEQVRAQAANGGGLELVELDLASLASVRACAEALVSAGKPVGLIIANARVTTCPFGKITDGFETQFGTNHLGHFVFVNRIASLLGPGSRLVNLSSTGRRFSDVDLDDPNFEHTTYTEFGAYGRSKTGNILFAVEFDHRHNANGVRATAVHPGDIQTELGRHLNPEAIPQLIDQINAATAAPGGAAFSWKPIPQGTATTVWSGIVASAGEVDDIYCEDRHVTQRVEGNDIRGGVRAYALDPDRAKALWARSEEMVDEPSDSLCGGRASSIALSETPKPYRDSRRPASPSPRCRSRASWPQDPCVRVRARACRAADVAAGSARPRRR